MRSDYDAKAYHPKFNTSFLAPKYWGTWLAIIICIPLACLPKKFHFWLSKKVAHKLAKQPRGTIHNIEVNLALCFPNKSDVERQTILIECLTTAGAFLLGFPRVTLLGRSYLKRNSKITGLEHIENARKAGKNIILMAPHSWTIDILPILLAEKELPVSAMAKEQRNPILDWLMHRQRVQFGGRVYMRSGGIKPFIKSVRDGYVGYYLPDQDHGREHSVFAELFSTPKATLPGLGKLAKVSNATVLPTFSRYNLETGLYDLTIFPEWPHFPNGNEIDDAKAMNQFIEQQVSQTPEQYMWILQLFRTHHEDDSINRYRKSK